MIGRQNDMPYGLRKAGNVPTKLEAPCVIESADCATWPPDFETM